MPTTRTYRAIRFRHAQKEDVNDVLTTESALQISVNGEPFTMTMRTPGSDKALVRGLLHSEDVVNAGATSYRYQTSCIDENGDISAVNVILDKVDQGNGLDSERSLMSVSSCGICGKQDADSILPEGDPLETDYRLDPEDLYRMFRIMEKDQNTFIRSGGSHAAAAFDSNVNMLTLGEDIGRHNAVDKVIGQCLLDGTVSEAKVLLVSGRISFEIITKTFKAGIPFLAAVSAPSNLAVEFAEKLGITLMAFCRDEKCTVYSRTDRMLGENSR